MALNYAEVWQPELLETLIQGTLTSPFITEPSEVIEDFTSASAPIL